MIGEAGGDRKYKIQWCQHGGIDISASKYKNSEAEMEIKDVSFTTCESTAKERSWIQELVKFKEVLVTYMNYKNN